MFSIVAMGKVGEDLVYRKRKKISDVKKYTKTINPNTPGQQVQKGYFKNAINAWSVDGYSAADKFAWDQFAKTKKVITSGFNRFTSSKIIAEKEGYTWERLTNCIIYDVKGSRFKVDINVDGDYSGKLYFGTSKLYMVNEVPGVFSVDKYTFDVTGLSTVTKYYFYIKNTAIGKEGRTGIYVSKTTGEIIFTYTSQYPPAHNSTYVKATSEESSFYRVYYATNPAKSLIGTSALTSWASGGSKITDQRVHIDLGTAKIIRRIYYENFHKTAERRDRGVKNFTFWGSNDEGSFENLNYATDTGWTQLTTAQPTFDQHIHSNSPDPKYIIVTNSDAYRYYAFKFADNHESTVCMGVRRVELQTRD